MNLLKVTRLSAVLMTTALMFAAVLSSSPVFSQTPPPASTTVTQSKATIRALQEALNKQGIRVKVDGVLNEQTRAAVKKFQSQHHLPMTGEPDKATLDKLGVVVAQADLNQAASPPSQTAANMMANCPMMQGRMQDMMKMMQSMMEMMRTMQSQMPQAPR
jgi:peptidoglycan hydrolase-like protein with peptidoglycan-binding domain